MAHAYKKKNSARKYNLMRDVPSGVLYNYARKILEYAGSKEKVLDLGFGTGMTLEPLSNLSKDSEILGIDNSSHMCSVAKKSVGDKVSIYNTDLRNFSKREGKKFDVIHFKALLHCLEEPEKELDLMAKCLNKGGHIITGHERGQTEDRIEQIFDYGNIDDSEIEILFSYYFRLRVDIGKPFRSRNFPAGYSWNACKYLIDRKNFSLVRTYYGKDLSWKRGVKIIDIIKAMHEGTFEVFSKGLTKKDREEIRKRLLKFVKYHQIDLYKERKLPSRFKIFIMKKN